jgi:hypothetical protein
MKLVSFFVCKKSVRKGLKFLFSLQTLIFALICLFAVTYAIPAPPAAPRLLKRAAAPEENVDDLKDGEEEKDLKAEGSAYYGSYYGWPGYSPYSYYSRVYHGGYWPYSYSPYSYWW